MKNVLPANRIAAAGGFLTALAGAAVGVTNSLPQTWQATAVTIVGVVGAVGTALHFMSGSQKFDQLQAASATNDGWMPSAALSPQAPEPEPEPAPEPTPAPAPLPAPAPVAPVPTPAPAPAPAPPDGNTV